MLTLERGERWPDWKEFPEFDPPGDGCADREDGDAGGPVSALPVHAEADRRADSRGRATEHLGYAPGRRSWRGRRITGTGDAEDGADRVRAPPLEIPRDREGTFRRSSCRPASGGCRSSDAERAVAYARGVSVREIQEALGAALSGRGPAPSVISAVTAEVMEEVDRLERSSGRSTASTPS
ncbi:MAG: transposase [Gemmatimonadetes bacterium]|nr:transposase [Gemmatimonadota bacterium]